MKQLDLDLTDQIAADSSPDSPGLTPERLEVLYEEIRTVYLADSRPWVIGYSGGKDSTTALQLCWLALAKLEPEQLKKPVYVISSDTLVESPVVAQKILSIHKQINQAAQETGMPFEAHVVYPRTSETFWVNMVGKGYPAPYKRFRWCTDRLKIQPANRFIMEKVATYGEVVLVLGVRRAESASRAQVMALHKRFDSKLSRHSSLTNAFVFTPVEDWVVEDVWSYLMAVASPWGANNNDLVALYRNATGECPLVVDTTTPSCGNSRFGCWTCTVVERDKSMEALIDNGEDWMEPLLELRDWLVDTQNPDTKEQYREVRRRDGRVHYWGDNREKLIWGPYKLTVRQDILRQVLEAQNEVRELGPDPEIELIRPEELFEIRRLWRVEEGDWTDTVPQIYRSVTGADLDWPDEDVSSQGHLELSILKESAAAHDLPVGLLRELIDLEARYHGMSRRSNIFNRIESILRKDWISDEEVFATLEERQKEAELQGGALQ